MLNMQLKNKSFSPESEVWLELDNLNAAFNMKYYLYNQTYLTLTIGWGKCIHEFLAPLRWLNYVWPRVWFNWPCHSTFNTPVLVDWLPNGWKASVPGAKDVFSVFATRLCFSGSKEGEAVFKALYLASVYRIFKSE